MSKMIKVEGHPNLVRDPKSGAILNINKNEIRAAKKRKEIRAQRDAEFEQVKQDVAELKNATGEILSLLKDLTEKK